MQMCLKHQSASHSTTCWASHRYSCSCYECVDGGLDEVQRRVEKFMGRFNEESKALKMELVLFKGGGTRRSMVPECAWIC